MAWEGHILVRARPARPVPCVRGRLRLVSMEKNSRVYVAGQGGLVGRAICRKLADEGFSEIYGHTRRELDLEDRSALLSVFAEIKPAVVIDAAAMVGGIGLNSVRPFDFLQRNLSIQLNLMDASHISGVERFVFLSSSCAYPREARQPLKTADLFSGPLESTNRGYAMAKTAGIVQVQSYRQQHNRPWISLIPTNLYGPYDNFDLGKAHVVPAMMRKLHDAQNHGKKFVEFWGSGQPLRELMFVDDLASAVLFCLEKYDSDEPLNLGVNDEISMVRLAELLSEIVGYEGEIRWDSSKPDGMARKKLDTEPLTALGWRSEWELLRGLEETYSWYQASLS